MGLWRLDRGPEIVYVTPKRTSRIFSIRLDTEIIELIGKAARDYGFRSASAFARFIICEVLKDLGYKVADSTCYGATVFRDKILEANPELEVAIANAVMELFSRRINVAEEAVEWFGITLLYRQGTRVEPGENQPGPR